MNIQLLKLDKNVADNIKYFKYIEKWYSDEELKYNITPNFEEQELEFISAEYYMSSFDKSKTKEIYIILDNDKPIGELSIDYNFIRLAKQVDKSAWISICIGDKNYHGNGVGTKAMSLLENICKEKGMKRIELGVFEFNIVAQKLYKKCGYNEITRFKNFTYKKGIWYSDIRMEKLL